MCSIMAYCGQPATDFDFLKAFNKTISRGPDDTRIIDTGSGFLGFHRLAIMGLTPEGMQPFELDGNFVVCNGEIYGYEKLKNELVSEYTFKSGSDCEILLPLFRKHNVELFAKLDGEFALIIYDKNTDNFIAARDPIGIRPLYYGYDKNGVIVFASEAKCLLSICSKIMPFPPGYYYKNGEFICYNNITKINDIINDDIETICSNIHDKLIAGVEKRLVADAKVGFLLSGGLDSSLVCAIAQTRSKAPVRTFAIGMESDAIDLKYARQVADFINSNHTEVIISKKQIIESLENVIYLLGTYDITTIRASLGMYLLCKWIHENTDIRVILTGEISDELFGYKYTDFAPSAKAFQEESIKRIKELHMYDVLRADRCISVNSLEARVPFGDLDFVNYVLSINPEKKLNRYGIGKYLLRHAFEGNYLPHDILYREKAAFSDAVGHSLVDCLKAYAEAFITDEEYTQLCNKYSHAKPFTKESLLYREVFEKFYPGQSEMIVDFWMPNKSWEGCNVSDPSARVLSNYGKSGQ